MIEATGVVTTCGHPPAKATDHPRYNAYAQRTDDAESGI